VRLAGRQARQIKPGAVAGSLRALAEGDGPGQRLGLRWRRSVQALTPAGRAGSWALENRVAGMHGGVSFPLEVFKLARCNRKDTGIAFWPRQRPPGWKLPIVRNEVAAIEDALIEPATGIEEMRP